jgi:hypothetical protein
MIFYQLSVHPNQTVTSQETPSVGVEDSSDYLRSGNVKLNDQSLELPDQETSGAIETFTSDRQEDRYQQHCGNYRWGLGHILDIYKHGLSNGW